MLYRLSASADALGKLEPLPFLDAGNLQQREKDLENLLASHLLDVLFEDAPLLAMFQERQLQAEADLYAVNRNGDLVIFELKRGAPERMQSCRRSATRSAPAAGSFRNCSAAMMRISRRRGWRGLTSVKPIEMRSS